MLRIGERAVGGDAPVFVIAEAGVNHDGDAERALELVEAAAAAGADAVKFQTFDPAALVAARTRPARYQNERAGAVDQRAMLEGLVLGEPELRLVAEHAARTGIIFLSTPFDEAAADLLQRLDVVAYKVGSGDLTNLPFLASLARRGRPMIVSTGMADDAEVAAAVQAIRDGGCCELALLHCVSSYPTPADQANLRAMDTLRAAYPDVAVGYSDHCEGLDVSLAAVARGAEILERHLTLDRSLPGPDHAISLEPGQLAELVQRVRDVRGYLGDGVKAPQPSERDVMAVARRSVVAARDLRAGERLELSALAVKRPAGGMAPAAMPLLVGRRVTRDVSADAQIAEGDLEPES